MDRSSNSISSASDPLSMSHFLTDAPRWLLLLSLVYAPWAFGCTRPWTIDVLNALLGSALLLWVVSCAVRRVRPVVHWVVAAIVAFLLLQGWWMAFNAHWLFDPEYFSFVPIASWWTAGPGTLDRSTSVAMMLRVSALLGVICLVNDLSRFAEWRRRVWWTMVLTGTSVVAFGMVQKFAGVPLLPFEDVRPGTLYFSTYFYHGNAGAFINLVVPLVAGLTVVAARKSEKSRLLLLPAAVICVAGAFINASRAAAVVTLLMLGVITIWQFRVWWREILLIPRRAAVIYTGLVLFGIVVLVVALPATRWAMLAGQINVENPRWISTQVLLRMLPDAGAWGLGPGTFHLAFPHYTRELGTAIRGVWRFAHEDYLQALIEWGWMGTAAWAVLFLGGLVRCFHFCRGKRSAERALLFTSGLALVGVALHALVDFPLQIASLQLYVAIYLGFGWGSSEWVTGKSNGPSAPKTVLSRAT